MADDLMPDVSKWLDKIHAGLAAMKRIYPFLGLVWIGCVLAISGSLTLAPDVLHHVLGLPPSVKLFDYRSVWLASGVCALLYSVWAIGSVVTRKVNESAAIVRLAERAELSLQFYADGRTPSSVRHVNVWRWYFLPLIRRSVDVIRNIETQETVYSILFLTFDPEVSVSTLRVDAAVQLPPWEIKEFNPRFAIIAFSGQIPACMLTVSVCPVTIEHV
jgi:hypothetical protein